VSSSFDISQVVSGVAGQACSWRGDKHLATQVVVSGSAYSHSMECTPIASGAKTDSRTVRFPFRRLQSNCLLIRSIVLVSESKKCFRSLLVVSAWPLVKQFFADVQHAFDGMTRAGSLRPPPPDAEEIG
jgi:hypothetical protein